MGVGGAVIDDVGGGVNIAAPDQPFGVRRDTLWPKTVAMWIGMSVFFLLLSVQAVSPTRRWRIRRRARRSPAS